MDQIWDIFFKVFDSSEWPIGRRVMAVYTTYRSLARLVQGSRKDTHTHMHTYTHTHLIHTHAHAHTYGCTGIQCVYVLAIWSQM